MPAPTGRPTSPRIQGVRRAVRARRAARASRCSPSELGLDSVAISDHFQPFRHRGGHAPASLPWLGALAAQSERIIDRHERLHADVPLPAGRGRARLRDARLPRPGSRLPRRRHRRVAERGRPDRHRVARRRRAAEAAARGRRSDPPALERAIACTFEGECYRTGGADDLRQARDAGADLDRGGGAEGRRTTSARQATVSSRPRASRASSTPTRSSRTRAAGAEDAGADSLADIERMLEVKLSYAADIEQAADATAASGPRSRCPPR